MVTMDSFVNTFMENLPHTPTKPQTLDLVLNGGAFNGSYMLGVLYFLREMKQRNYIHISRISGCSIGAFLGLLYYGDQLPLFSRLYSIIRDEYTQTGFMSTLLQMQHYLLHSETNELESSSPSSSSASSSESKDPHGPSLTREEWVQRVNGKLFISYYNVRLRKKCVKSVFKSYEDLCNTVIKSCFVPLLINGNLLYKRTYMDGIHAHVFRPKPNRRILYIDLCGYDKIGDVFSITHEKTNYHRVLSGLLEIHTFFIKGRDTSMCSYVDRWTVRQQCQYRVQLALEQGCVSLVSWLSWFAR